MNKIRFECVHSVMARLFLFYILYCYIQYLLRVLGRWRRGSVSNCLTHKFLSDSLFLAILLLLYCVCYIYYKKVLSLTGCVLKVSKNHNNLFYFNFVYIKTL